MATSQLTLDRRNFLSAAGVSIALPMLESIARAKQAKPERDAGVKRLVCVGLFLGFHQDAIYPKQSGRNYEMSPLLEPLAEHRNDFTIFSGLDHRAAPKHANWGNFLCGKNVGDVSLDQIVAEKIGQDSRFPSVHVTAGRPTRAMSFTRQGVGLPMIQRPSVLYNKLFVSAGDRAHTEYLLKSGRSSLDLVLEEARQLQSRVSSRDRQKLGEYFSAMRSVEKGISRQLAGIDDPVPQTDYKLPGYDPLSPQMVFEAESLMYDLMALALETDSSRVLTMYVNGAEEVYTIDGKSLQLGYHALSHHGNDPDKIRELVMVTRKHLSLFSGFLDQLKSKTDSDGKPLLDSTTVLMGTGMGDASIHDNTNLPTIVAGGGFQHGQHVAVDPGDENRPMLGDLYITMMQRFGIEVDHFSNSNHNLNHLFV
jgi:hypothetical protein